MALRSLRKYWVVGDGFLGVFILSKALPTRMTCCAMYGIQYQPFAYWLASWCAATTGWRSLAFCSCAATLISTPESPKWSYVAVGGVSERRVILQDDHIQNHSLTCLSVCSYRDMATTLGDMELKDAVAGSGDGLCLLARHAMHVPILVGRLLFITPILVVPILWLLRSLRLVLRNIGGEGL